MKLVLYIIIYFITIILIIKPINKRQPLIFFLWISLLLFLCYVIQSTVSDPDSDLEKYASIFKSDKFVWNPNLLREFLFWGLTRFLYSLFQDRNITFLILNLFFSAMILKGFINYKNTNDNLYLLFGFLLFFPFLNGIHVVYRQLIAMSIMFFSLSCFYNNRNLLGSFSFIVSFLFHNLTLLFFPLIFFSFKKFYNKYLMFLGLLILPLALRLTETSQNEFLIRHDINYLPTLSIAYLFIFLLLLFLILIINYNNNIKSDYFNKLIFILLLINIISFFALLSNLTIERIGIFSIAFIYFYTGFYINRFKNKVFVKLTFFHICLIPLLTFYNHYLS